MNQSKVILTLLNNGFWCYSGEEDYYNKIYSNGSRQISLRLKDDKARAYMNAHYHYDYSANRQELKSLKSLKEFIKNIKP